jgi:hypothetical protein
MLRYVTHKAFITHITCFTFSLVDFAITLPSLCLQSEKSDGLQSDDIVYKDLEGT